MKSTSDMKERVRTVLVIFGMNMLAVLFVAGVSAAGILDDIPEGLSSGLGLDNTYIAEAILSMMVLLSVTLALAVARTPSPGVIIILLVTIGVLTAIGWLDTWVIVLVAILIAALFGKAIISGFQPGHGSDE